VSTTKKINNKRGQRSPQTCWLPFLYSDLFLESLLCTSHRRGNNLPIKLQMSKPFKSQTFKIVWNLKGRLLKSLTH